MPNKELLEAITSSDFLNGCSFDSSSVIRKAYSAGAYLSDNNNGKGFIGLIASGILDIYSVALDGRDTMLNSLHKGNCFGICNLFDCTQMELSLIHICFYFVEINSKAVSVLQCKNYSLLFHYMSFNIHTPFFTCRSG